MRAINLKDQETLWSLWCSSGLERESFTTNSGHLRPHRRVLRLQQLPESYRSLWIPRQLQDRRRQFAERLTHLLQLNWQVLVREELLNMLLI